MRKEDITLKQINEIIQLLLVLNEIRENKVRYDSEKLIDHILEILRGDNE